MELMTRNSRQQLANLVVGDLSSVELGDERRDARLLASAAAVAGDSKRSFPQVFRSEAAREAFYRLLRNPAVDADDVLAPHAEATVERAAFAQTVVVAHDESELVLRGDHREGLGDVSNSAPGIYIRGSLLVDASNDARTPLGVLRMERYVHHTQPRVSASAAVLRSRKKPQTEKETDWWRQAAHATSELLEGHPDVVHVMDREADSYALLASLLEGGRRFVIRARHDRVLTGGSERKLKALLWKEEGHLFREVPLSRRRLVNRKGAHPARNERVAQLFIRKACITVPRPEGVRVTSREIQLNVVQVYEPNPPSGETAIEWTLLTSESVASEKEMSRIVDCYRARWRIEEYFKALKSGCAVEKRQLESLETIANALAIFVPVAWALLYLRSTARQIETAPASEFFTREQLTMLKALCPDMKLPKAPTMREAMLAIANLGGHIKQNGEPGWEVLGRGFVDFIAAERGWLAAKGRICDQS